MAQEIDDPDGPDGYEDELDWRFYVRLGAAAVLLAILFGLVFQGISLIGTAVDNAIQ